MMFERINVDAGRLKNMEVGSCWSSSLVLFFAHNEGDGLKTVEKI